MNDNRLSNSKRTEMLKLFHNAFTCVSCFRFANVIVWITANFKDDKFDFEITVFAKQGENHTFNFYEFNELDDTANELNRVLDLIKTDDFAKIVSSKNHKEAA